MCYDSFFHTHEKKVYSIHHEWHGYRHWKSPEHKYRVASKIYLKSESIGPSRTFHWNAEFITVINDAYQNSLDKQMANRQTIGSILHWATCNLRRWLSIRDKLFFCCCCCGCYCWVTSWMSIAVSIQRIEQQSIRFSKLQTENFNGITMILHRFIDLLTTRFFYDSTSFSKGFIAKHRHKFSSTSWNRLAANRSWCFSKKYTHVVWLSWCFFLDFFLFHSIFM